MRTTKTLGPNPVTFSYEGSVTAGVVIHYPSGNVFVTGEFFGRILRVFRGGKRVPGGFSVTNPTPSGLGEWIRGNCEHNSRILSPKHGSRIAAILVAEGYATSQLEGGAVWLTFR